MKFPPSITEADIVHLLEEQYGVLAMGLRHIPTDWTPYNYGYAVKTSEGECYFFKLYGASADPYPARSRRFFIPLTYKLHQQDIIPHVPHPLTTKDGTLWVEVPDYMGVLQPFIEGVDVGFGDLPDDVLRQLATQVGKLHRASDQLSFEYPLSEDYQILCESELNATLQQKDEWKFGNNHTLRKLMDVFDTYADSLHRSLNFVHQAPATASFAKAKVICHTDLHGGNLRLDAKRRLYILDWENALIAPAEHDLFFFVGEPYFWAIFWPLYTKAFGGIPQLEPDIFRYYFYRRALEDITGYAERIVNGKGDTKRNINDLDQLEAILKGLPMVDVTVKHIADKITTMETELCD